MKLLYVNEHLICENYERSTRPVFENFHLEKDKNFEKRIEEAEILFVMEGAMELVINDASSYYKRNTVILLPPACDINLFAFENLHIIVLRVKSVIHLCNIQPLSSLMGKKSQEVEDNFSLDINERLKTFLTLLSTCLDDGLKCKCFMDLKAKEVFYYFRAYYNKELLKLFFAPLLTKDYTFSIFVLQNHKKVKTVQEFAKLYGYSLSCFEKRFKKIFRVSAYHWMKEQKSKAIYHDLIYTDTPLIELADEYYFSSLSQFCDFCKKEFGVSPGKIRADQKCLNNSNFYEKIN